MRRPILAMLVLVLALPACGGLRDSRLNPFNWFGRAERAQPVPAAPQAPVDQRLLVAEVTGLTIDRTPGGAIVRATGLPPRQGFWDAELVARPIEDGVLVFDFRVFPPIEDTSVSTQRSREIVVATFLTDIRLAQVRQITVQGERSARTTRR
ncbi:MAG TPA: hypothetical protein PKD10_07440 [Paracoccaceae bacterium]|nr:hypothetical protein [Paracoccaceae bacterium]HMO70524.1 hypothetical protein [Paracoccaceae bacterium]